MFRQTSYRRIIIPGDFDTVTSLIKLYFNNKNNTNLVGSHARSNTQLLVSDDVDVHDDELLHLSRVTEAVERVPPVRVSIHLSN